METVVPGIVRQKREVRFKEVQRISKNETLAACRAQAQEWTRLLQGLLPSDGPLIPFQIPTPVIPPPDDGLWFE